MRLFASPGIDSPTDEVGIFNSGAGQTPNSPAALPDTPGRSAVPSDWSSNNPLWDKVRGFLIGNYGATASKAADATRVRARGVSPFGGSGKPWKHGYYQEKAQGTTDFNLGASSHIAGGSSQAATMVRVNGARKKNEGQKLPILPADATRGGSLPVPAGGFVSGLAAPLVPQVPGLPSIFKMIVPTTGKAQ